MKNHKLWRAQSFFIVILLLFFLNENSYAQRQWAGAVLIETENAGDAVFPDIGMDAAGNAIAVWRQWDGVSSNIWANRYTAGSGWGVATLIETDTRNAFSPRIAMDANGNAIAVWQQDDGVRWNIWANRYTAGSGWGVATLIETDNGYTGGPQIATDANGNAIAVWQQSDGVRWNIWANRYSVGSGWGTATLIETDNAGTASNPQIAMDANGNAIAVWEQVGIWANRYTTGSGWGAATLIETGPAFNPTIAMDAAGNAIAVWMQEDGARYSIWANRYTAGSGWGVATLIEIDTGSAHNPTIATDANDTAIAVWTQYDGVRYNIWANRYTAGSGWGTATLIETDNAGTSSNPQIAMDANGNAIAVWAQAGSWANRYTVGSGWGAAMRIGPSTGSGDPRIAMDAAGNAIAVFALLGAFYDIAANRFGPPCDASQAGYQSYGGDVNGDGLQDVLLRPAPNFPNACTLVLLSSIGGTYSLDANPPPSIVNSPVWQGGSHDLVFGDVLGNGTRAMVIRARTQGGASFLIATSVTGAPQLLEQFTTARLGIDISAAGTTVELSDTNGDHRADMTVKVNGAVTNVFLADASGMFDKGTDETTTQNNTVASVRAVWGGFGAALNAGNTSQALQYISTASAPYYSSVLAALGSQVTGLSAYWSDIKLVTIGSGFATFTIVETYDAQRTMHILGFIQEGGRWVLEDF